MSEPIWKRWKNAWLRKVDTCPWQLQAPRGLNFTTTTLHTHTRIHHGSAQKGVTNSTVQPALLSTWSESERDSAESKTVRGGVTATRTRCITYWTRNNRTLQSRDAPELPHGATIETAFRHGSIAKWMGCSGWTGHSLKLNANYGTLWNSSATLSVYTIIPIERKQCGEQNHTILCTGNDVKQQAVNLYPLQTLGRSIAVKLGCLRDELSWLWKGFQSS